MLGYYVEQIAIGIATGAIYAIVAIGFNLIFGVMNILNMAHGATMMVGTFGLLLVFYLGVENFWLGAIVGVALALVTGLLVERIGVRPLKGNWWNTKVATIGIAFFLENLVTRITEGRPQPFPRPFDTSWQFSRSASWRRWSISCATHRPARPFASSPRARTSHAASVSTFSGSP